jgi:hypothetical protein
MPKITALTVANTVANSDLIVITTNTAGTAVTRSLNVASLAAALDVASPVVKQLNTTTGNVVSNTTSFAVNVVGANGLFTSATGNTVTVSANLQQFQSTISQINTPTGNVVSNNALGFTTTFTNANGVLITATGNSVAFTFDPATINTLTDTFAPVYNNEGSLPTASSAFNGHNVVAGTKLYHGASDQFIRQVDVQDSADEMVSHVKFTLAANGSGAWNVTGGGARGTDNETLYLYKGMTYQFNNPVHASHPLAIRIADGGSAHSNGVSNNATGNTTYFTVPQNQTANVYLQCTNHAGMIGTLVIVT